MFWYCKRDYFWGYEIKKVVSVIIKHVSFVVITSKITLLYLRIYNLGRTHKWFLYSLIHFTYYYSTVARKTYFRKSFTSPSLNHNSTAPSHSSMWDICAHGIFSTKLLLSLSVTAACFVFTTRCFSLRCSLWLCSTNSKELISRKRQ